MTKKVITENVIRSEHDLAIEKIVLGDLVDQDVDSKHPMFERVMSFHDATARLEKIKQRDAYRSFAEENVSDQNAGIVKQIRGLKSSGDFVIIKARETAALFIGRKEASRESIPSLPRVASSIGILFNSTAKDNPYVDYALIEIEKVINETHELINQVDTILSARFKELKTNGINIAQFETEDRQFSTDKLHSPYGYKLISMLIEFDKKVAMPALTLHYKSFMTKDDYTAIMQTVKRKIRHVYDVVLRFDSGIQKHAAGITRRDFVCFAALSDLEKKRLEHASKKLGDIPLDILRAEAQPEFSRRKEEWSEQEQILLANATIPIFNS